MPEKLFKEKLINTSAKKWSEIGQVVNQSGSLLKKFVLPQNLFSLSFFLNFTGIFVSFVFLNRLPPKIPLFYSRVWGDDQLAKAYFIFLPSLLASGFTLVNYWGSKTFQKKQDNLIPSLCGSFSLLSSLTTNIAVIKIISLVI